MFWQFGSAKRSTSVAVQLTLVPTQLSKTWAPAWLASQAAYSMSFRSALHSKAVLEAGVTRTGGRASTNVKVAAKLLLFRHGSRTVNVTLATSLPAIHRLAHETCGSSHNRVLLGAQSSLASKALRCVCSQALKSPARVETLHVTNSEGARVTKLGGRVSTVVTTNGLVAAELPHWSVTHCWYAMAVVAPQPADVLSLRRTTLRQTKV